jgi:2-oxo-4-hydroxy-4-carboxy-5-ureidoimidazoline decarboxylase
VTLEQLNAASGADARAALERCCGTRAWVERMVASRPFASEDELLTRAEAIWRALPGRDWKEAFAHHPRIGDLESLAERFATTAPWADREQAGAVTADPATLAALLDGNRAYESRFGFRFIVCATGRSAQEMLALLEARLQNPADVELGNAAREQLAIARLRLQKLLKEQ